MLWCAAAMTLVLNLVDGLFTMAFVRTGLATEANPFMAVPLNWGNIHFMVIKLLLVSAGVVLLWQWRKRSLARQSIYLMAGVYSAIVVHHFWLVTLVTAA